MSGIAFDARDEDRLLALWEEVLRSRRWTQGPFTAEFEQCWSASTGPPAVAFSGWSGAAMAALDFVDVRGEVVLCPSNTALPTALAVLRAGGRPAFVDCNREDLCASFEHFRWQAERVRPKAAWVVHIGGHIAFEIEEIADYCRRRGIRLLEDCAHAHGADWNGRAAGTWGDAGVYSFHATKTISTGEGGMLVSRNGGLIEFARRYRSYGGDAERPGLNFRIHEFTAAMGVVQAERLDDIVVAKNRYAREALDPQHPRRVRLPPGMRSGLYKYIVFAPIEHSTGKVYDRPCHRSLGPEEHLPNTEWVAGNHWCVPVPYPPP